jgi:4-amino-4-deoxy-L-arabinose transferase-like glycosyltransferase
MQRRLLWGVLAIAFLLRLAVALALPIEFGNRADTEEYLAVADNLLTNGVFGEQKGVPYAVIPPGYPLLIAGVFAVSGDNNLYALRVVQALLGVLIIWQTYVIGRESLSSYVGLGAATIMALYPPWLLYTNFLLTESLYTLFALGFILYLVRSLKAPTAKNVALAAVWYALALLTRETLIALPLLLPLLCWWANLPLRQWLRNGFLFAVTVLIVISPWLARNALTFGYAFYTERTNAIRFQLSGSGYLSSRFEKWVEERDKSPEESLSSKNLEESYQRFGRTSDMRRLSFALSDPVTYIRYLFNRYVEFWLHPNGLEALPNSLPIRALYVAVHLVLIALASWQIIAYLREHHIATGSLVLVLLYLTIVITFFRRPLPRYNLPFLPIVFVFSASGASWLLKHLLPQKWLPHEDQA